MSKKALIFGISGQDGSYLAEHLLTLGYQVCGTIRRNSLSQMYEKRLKDILSDVHFFYSDLLDYSSIREIISSELPDEIYNLAAQSHVGVSSKIPFYTAQVNALAVVNILEVCREIDKEIRFYQASSSECFGNTIDKDGFQRETTPMNPVNPYAIAKTFSYHMVKHYRSAYNLFACNGILFNHESPRRGENFVTAKIIRGAIRIKFGLQKELRLGNLDSHRDWGHSKDYVKAMHMILNYIVPEDFVIATGKTHSIRELCKYVFDKLGLDYIQFVIIDPQFVRPQELIYLKGDSTKAKQLLGWEPEYNFETLIDDMMSYWMEHYKDE